MARRGRRSPAAIPPHGLDLRVVPPPLSLVEDRTLRWSRIRNARARIAAGYYDREDVRSRLADAVLRRMRRP